MRWSFSIVGGTANRMVWGGSVLGLLKLYAIVALTTSFLISSVQLSTKNPWYSFILGLIFPASYTKDENEWYIVDVHKDMSDEQPLTRAYLLVRDVDIEPNKFYIRDLRKDRAYGLNPFHVLNPGG